MPLVDLHLISMSAVQAPKPLLPNYGYGSARTYLQDVNMLILLNGGERTLNEFKDVGCVHHLPCGIKSDPSCPL